MPRTFCKGFKMVYYSKKQAELYAKVANASYDWGRTVVACKDDNGNDGWMLVDIR